MTDSKDLAKMLTIDSEGVIKPKIDWRETFDDVFSVRAPEVTYRDYLKACIRSNSEPMPEARWNMLFKK